MKLSEFPLLTDENINPAVVQFLRQQQFDVIPDFGGGVVRGCKQLPQALMCNVFKVFDEFPCCQRAAIKS